MSHDCDFLVGSPFVRSMIVHDNKYAFDIIDLSGEYEGRLNFMIKAARGISYKRLINIVQKSAKENITDTIILAFYLRDCRQGKGERDLGRKVFQWLAINYPKKFVHVLKMIPEYGRWDDLFVLFPNAILLNRMDNYLSKNVDIESVKKLQSVVVKLFASRLQEDVECMKRQMPITLCAKWAPTENDKRDQQYDLVQTLCEELHIQKSKYRKTIISPLRKHLRLVETTLQKQDLHNIKYDCIPNVAFQKYFNVFKKRDELSFNLYLKNTDVNAPKTSNIFPHDILREYHIFDTHEINETLETKWSYYLKNYQRVHITKTIPILHTSSSMYDDKDMFIRAISLALFIARKSDDPFNNLIIRNVEHAFQYIPQHEDVMTTMKSLIEYTEPSSIDMLSVMKKIVENAKQNNLKTEDMPNTLIYICDVDCIKKHILKSAFSSKSVLMQKIQNLFEEHGYTSPRIIFFNMNAKSVSFPMLSNHHNVGMVSGYSPSVLNSLLYNDGELFTCKTILNNILYKERYTSLRHLIK